MEFLELIETLRAQDASPARLFGDAGRSVRQTTQRAAYAAKLAEAAALLSGVMKGRIPAYRLQEALSTSDFPQLFGDILDRQVLANYAETPASWPAFCRRAVVNDFRTVKRLRIDGGESILEEVAQLAPYPETAVTDDQYTYSIKKYGRKMPFSWETMINDDLNALQDIPARFGRASRRSEEKFATQLIADTNGPHASLYTAGNKNIINTTNGATATNPALSISGLQDGFIVLANQVDSEGEPITIDAVVLVVPPALEVTAMNILNATDLIVGADTAAQRIMTANWIRNRLRVVVNSYLPIVSTTNGNTSWYLFASPANGRPAVEMGFLRGHESPEIFMKTPNAQRVGGGGENPLNGDFENDSIEYKIRHVFGGTRLDPKMTVASNGSGS